MTAPLGRHRPEDDEPDFETLAALADGRLDAPEQDAVTAHLAECERCRDIVAGLAARAPATDASWRRTLLPVAASVAIAAGAGAYLLTRSTEAPSPASIAAPAQRSTLPAKPPPTVPAVPAPASGRSGPVLQRERTRAAGTTVVAGKTFRLVAGEWVDAAFRETDVLPVIEVGSREELAARPELRPYAELGSRFTVVENGTVYRIVLPAR